ncbi:uncharacterized protein [Elaeis guineensis]|uniref:Uncharacterized protein LOC105036201 n=2 Tax=Elaeis guineensis var. tenera TaxID=51953 RepID=A0A6I9QIP0_ELAGV|nr:uncharacterized protein LOC105036201 [Elaeis guineensis]
MEEVFMQNQIPAMDKAGNMVLDIESLTQPSDKCSGSPKMTKALSRKGSSRMEKRNGEEQEADEASKKLVIKVGCSQLEQLKQPAMPIKVLVAPSTSANISGVADTGDGRSRRFHRLTTINPKKILLLFASMSSMGTMILIYFTLTISRRGEV